LPAEPFLRCHTDAYSQQSHDILCESEFNITDFVVRVHRGQTWSSGRVPCTHLQTQQEGDKEATVTGEDKEVTLTGEDKKVKVTGEDKEMTVTGDQLGVGI